MVGCVGPGFGSPAQAYDLGNRFGSFVGEQLQTGGGLQNALPGLFGDGQHGCCNQQTEALLRDIKGLLNQLLQQQNSACGHQGDHGCGSDPIYGGCGDDKMKGGRGDDHMYGGCGDDKMKGGRGDDHMYGGCGDDKMKGGRGDDHMYGGCGDDKMKGGRGDDHMYGGCGDDKMKGGRGDDHMYGGCGDDKMKGGRGDDHMYGGCGDDKMKGGRGDDFLYGGAGYNRLYGGRGDDTYVIESGSNNVIRDGVGSDTVKLDGIQDDYTMERDGDDLILTNKEDGTRVVIKNQFDGKGVDRLEFDDGTFDDFDSIGEEDCGCESTPPPCDTSADDVAPMPYPVLHAYEGGGDHDGGDGPGDSCDGVDSGGSDGCSI